MPERRKLMANHAIEGYGDPQSNVMGAMNMRPSTPMTTPTRRQATPKGGEAPAAPMLYVPPATMDLLAREVGTSARRQLGGRGWR